MEVQSRKKSNHLLFNFIIFLSFFTGLSAYAVNLQYFTRSNSLTFEMLEDGRLENSHVYNDFDLLFTLGGSWVDGPLPIKNVANSELLDIAVPHMYGLHYGVGYHIKPWMQLGLTGTYSFFETNHDEKRQGFSDVVLNAKARILNGSRYAVSIMPMLFIPTGAGKFTPRDDDGRGGFGEGAFLSDESFGFGGRLIGEYLFNWAQLVVNLGYRYSKEAVFERIDMDHQIYTGVGLYIPWYKSWGTNLEWVRLWSMPLDNKDINPNEMYVGISGAMSEHIHAFGGVGFGNMFDDIDGNDWRASLGVKIMSRVKSKKKEPLELVKLKKPVMPVMPEKPELKDLDTVECAKSVFDDSNVAVIRFKNDRANIADKTNEALMNVIEAIKLRVKDIKRIEVHGHTSRPGSHAYNKKLGMKRAMQVAWLLHRETGVKKPRIAPKSFGETKPLVTGPMTQAAQRENRRVEFWVEVENACEKMEKIRDVIEKNQAQVERIQDKVEKIEIPEFKKIDPKKVK